MGNPGDLWAADTVFGGALARVKRVSDNGVVVYAEFQNGNLVRLLADKPTDIDVGDILLVNDPAWMHRRSLAHTGLCVLFVVAPRRETASQAPREVLRKVKQDIQKAVRAYPGTRTDPTAARIGIASWVDLFPDAETACADLRMLPVERPTGRGYLGDPDGENVWEWAHYLDATFVPFAPDDAAWMTAVLDNAAGLRGVPHAVRTSSNRPSLIDLCMARTGFDIVGHAEGAKSLVGRGAVGAPKLPARLVY
ncbi:hypothetical protein J7E68_16345 [Microbacterium sp. ISL-103]|uniref:hypothetical protein n=1 Tax=Microbacterium sp. ISL-103 TaxID=2819156 RepID=UPI001BE7A267|nr:hypothetical protein [Microbacterium sp. ISL-103]MBT2476101.1 hypothetical protein [Microbacterium sp. ISL-103]